MLDGVPGSRVLPGIKRTLADLGVVFDVWTSEEGLHRWGRVAAALADLEARGALEERDGALFFKSESEGDDKDRVVRKRDGVYTYFASDIAYHADKIARGFDRLIDVWGADHHGYVARVRGALAALGLPGGALRGAPLPARLPAPERRAREDGQAARQHRHHRGGGRGDRRGRRAQGRRGGRAPLLLPVAAQRHDRRLRHRGRQEELASTTRSSTSRYGYARASSILAPRARGLPRGARATSLAKLTHPDELAIAARLGRFPRVVREAADLREPHRIVFYLQELSQDFQSYFTRHKDDAVLPQKKHTAEEGWEARWDWEQDARAARVGRGHPYVVRRGPRPARDHGARSDGSRRRGQGRRGRRRGDGA